MLCRSISRFIETGFQSIRETLILFLMALFVVTMPVRADDVGKGRRDVWVVVTRSTIACGNTDEDVSFVSLLLDTLKHPSSNGKLPEGCRNLKVGEKFLLDDRQTEAETKIAVVLWEGICPRGCLPSMIPLYAPPRRLVGAYLKPTKPPKGW